MSEVIKSVFVNYFICAIFGGILEYLTPPKGRNTLKICVVTVMLVASLSPLLKTEFMFENVINSEEAQIQEKYNSLMHTANLLEKNLYSQSKNILINLGIDEYEIYITTSLDEENNTVYLDEIYIELDKEYRNLVSQVYDSFNEEYKQVLKVGVKNE